MAGESGAVCTSNTTPYDVRVDANDGAAAGAGAAPGGTAPGGDRDEYVIDDASRDVIPPLLDAATIIGLTTAAAGGPPDDGGGVAEDGGEGGSPSSHPV